MVVSKSGNPGPGPVPNWYFLYYILIKANMAQVTLGKFFSGVPQIRESDGDSKKIYEHKRKRGFIDSWSKIFDGLHFYKYGGLMRISEIFLLENLSINVPYHRLTMTIGCLNFYSGNLSRDGGAESTSYLFSPANEKLELFAVF
jgi:hypothetical protein